LCVGWFFFSSRRRHTRSKRDWSSDVCSSDLRRLKNGRSWCTEGLDKFIDIMVALKDNLEIKTLHGILEHSLEQQEKEKPPKHFVEKITNSAAEATRDNIAYLKQAVGRP